MQHLVNDALSARSCINRNLLKIQHVCELPRVISSVMLIKKNFYFEHTSNLGWLILVQKNVLQNIYLLVFEFAGFF